MCKQNVFLFLIFHVLINNCHSSLSEKIIDTSTECLTNSLETSVYCRGTRAINNILENLSKSNKPIVIVRGLEILPTNRHNSNTASDNANLNNSDAQVDNAKDDVDDTFLGRLPRYLRTHELNIKFSDLMPTDESDLARDSEQFEARKKDKGNTMIMALGLMLSKMMAVVGLGGIGALAMKALGIAMTALMMATIVGIKTMAHQGNESSHSVQYVTADGHHHIRRRRRSTKTSSILLN